MALLPCHECGHNLSDEAKACPQCGAAPKGPTSRLKIAIIGFAIVGIGLTMSRPEIDAAAPEPKAEPYPRAELSPTARAILRAESKDADSLKFRNEFTARPGVYCGEVNGKNSFGGYPGFRRFIADHKTVLVDDESIKEFDKAWREFCAPQKSA